MRFFSNKSFFFYPVIKCLLIALSCLGLSSPAWSIHLGIDPMEGDIPAIDGTKRFVTKTLPTEDIHPHSFSFFKWLDNDRIILTALPKSISITGPERAKITERDYVIGVWDTRGKKLELSNVHGNVVCADPLTQNVQIDAFGNYSIKNDINPWHYMRGHWPDRLEPYDYYYRKFDPKSNYINEYSCLNHDGNPARLVPEYASEPLYEEHGMIIWDRLKRGYARQLNDYWFIKTGTTKKIPFTLAADDFWIDRISYVPFLQSYLLHGSYSRPSQTYSTEQPWINTMNLEGELTPHRVPMDLWRLSRHGGIAGTPSKVGWFWSYGSVDTNQGLYLETEQGLVRLSYKHPDDFLISPDGCRLAYGSAFHRLDGKETEADQPILTVLELCKGQ